ncbi:MAG: hypothetical protein VX185_01245 [Pseudomonadota bacterium]|nr:hypothetical protein [Pseudomonadota bacterium]
MHMTMSGITRDAFTQKGMDAQGLKGVLAYSDTPLKGLKGVEVSRLKFITHADHSGISQLDHKPLIMRDGTTGKLDPAWMKNINSKGSSALLNDIHLGGFRAHFDANGATGDTLEIKIDKSHGLGTMNIDPNEDESAHTWNKALDESAGSIVNAFKGHYPDKTLSFKVLEGSGMEDFVKLLNQKAGNEVLKLAGQLEATQIH